MVKVEEQGSENGERGQSSTDPTLPTLIFYEYGFMHEHTCQGRKGPQEVT